jgi:hypothetical protein
MALSAETPPQLTTRAAVVASLSVEITTMFRNLLLVGDEAGRSGREMCAVDGVQRPSNASKAWSGTTAAVQQKAPKMPAAVAQLVATHCANDARDAQGRSARRPSGRSNPGMQPSRKSRPFA